jgi:hypothetical protein
VALGIARARDQLDLPGGLEVGIAEDEAAVVARPGAERAELLHLGAVVVRVEAADEALPRRDHLGDAAAHRDDWPLTGLPDVSSATTLN